MKKRGTIFSCLFAVSLAATVGYTSCKDYNSDMFANLNSEIEKQKGELTANLDQKVQDLTTKLNALQQENDESKEQIAALQQAVTDQAKVDHDAIWAKLDSLAKWKADSMWVKNSIDGLQENIDELELVAVLLSAKDELLEEDIDTLKEHVEAIAAATLYLLEKSEELKETDEELKETDLLLSEAIIALSEVVSDKADKAEVAAKIAEVEELLNNFKEEQENKNLILATAIEGISDQIDSLFQADSLLAAKDAEIMALVDTKADEEYVDLMVEGIIYTLTNMQNKIDSVSASVDSVEAEIEVIDCVLELIVDELEETAELAQKNKEDIAKLADKIDMLFNANKNMITSLVLQGTYNPIFGQIALPVGLQTNILMGYYGVADKSYGMAFPVAGTPTADAVNPLGDVLYYADPQVAADPDNRRRLTEKDLQMLGVSAGSKQAGAGSILVSEANGNAGKVYFTVNPTKANMEGVDFTLVNSLDENAPLEISSIIKSEKKLQFGYNTRAQLSGEESENGFYEAYANVTSSNVGAAKYDKISITDLKEIGSIVKNVRSNGFKGSAKSLVKTLGQDLSNVSLDAHALKATWQDDSLGARSTYSNYGIATLAVKPLSYSFLKDASYSSVPGFSRVEALTEKIVSRVQALIVSKTGFLADFHIAKFPAWEDAKSGFAESLNMTVVIPAQDMPVTVPPITVDVPAQHVVVPAQSHIVTIPSMLVTVDVPGTTVGVPSKTLQIVVPDTTVVVPGQTINVDGKEGTIVATEVVVPGKTIDVTVDIDPITVPGQEVSATTPAKEVLVEIPAQTVTVPGQQFTSSPTTTNVHIDEMTYDMDLEPFVKGFYENFTEGDFAEMLDQIESALENVQNAIDNVIDVTNAYQEKALAYLDKAENIILKGINGFNNFIQPTLFIESPASFNAVSTYKTAPTKVKNNQVVLYPTSMTFEALAPSLYKLVGVTNVFDASGSAQGGCADCMAALNAANASLSASDGTTGVDVLNGNVTSVRINIANGYTYEIAYSTVDYSGKVVVKKYYIAAK